MESYRVMIYIDVFSFLLETALSFRIAAPYGRPFVTLMVHDKSVRKNPILLNRYMLATVTGGGRWCELLSFD